jgi:hypothetical protein
MLPRFPEKSACNFGERNQAYLLLGEEQDCAYKKIETGVGADWRAACFWRNSSVFPGSECFLAAGLFHSEGLRPVFSLDAHSRRMKWTHEALHIDRTASTSQVGKRTHAHRPLFTGGPEAGFRTA